MRDGRRISSGRCAPATWTGCRRWETAPTPTRRCFGAGRPSGTCKANSTARDVLTAACQARELLCVRVPVPADQPRRKRRRSPIRRTGSMRRRHENGSAKMETRPQASRTLSLRCPTRTARASEVLKVACGSRNRGICGISQHISWHDFGIFMYYFLLNMRKYAKYAKFVKYAKYIVIFEICNICKICKIRSGFLNM